MISCVASDTIVFVPFASTTGTIVQRIPIGVKYTTVPDNLQACFVAKNQLPLIMALHCSDHVNCKSMIV